jgi:NAD(P)-dependent dehydrogenase (short-subunit alcohol dehydrogenase family)
MCPGYVNTPLLQTAAESGAMDTEIAKIPMKRLADVDEVSDCIVFLASPMASYMTGSSLLADGGYTANWWETETDAEGGGWRKNGSLGRSREM